MTPRSVLIGPRRRLRERQGLCAADEILDVGGCVRRLIAIFNYRGLIDDEILEHIRQRIPLQNKCAAQAAQ